MRVIRWIERYWKLLTGPCADAGAEDSLSMEPFIMQRLIIIPQPLSLLPSRLWHIAFLNVRRSGPAQPRPITLLSQARDSSALAQRSPPAPLPSGNSHSGLSERWPGYCCLWYLLVNFCNQYNIRQKNPGERRAEAVHLIFPAVAALCSAAKLGSWPSWCGIIAAEVRWELSAPAADEWLFLIKRLSHLTRDI